MVDVVCGRKKKRVDNILLGFVRGGTSSYSIYICRVDGFSCRGFEMLESRHIVRWMAITHKLRIEGKIQVRNLHDGIWCGPYKILMCVCVCVGGTGGL